MSAAIFVCAVMTLHSCKDRGATDPFEGPPPDLRSAILPLQIGNSWVYLDSLITPSETSIVTYTVSVHSARMEAGRYWWRLYNRFNPSIDAREFMAGGDSIYSLQYREAPTGLVGVVSLEYVLPGPADTLSFQSLYSGDAIIRKRATRVAQEVHVPAGSFLGGVLYTYDINPEHYREVVVPGVGVLSCEIRADSSAFGPPWQRSIRLTAYELIK
jgi:hypothetical protein